MGRIRMRGAAQAAIDCPFNRADDKPLAPPGDPLEFLEHLDHHRITPHCVRENRLITRMHRILREELERGTLTDFLAAKKVLERFARRTREVAQRSWLTSCRDGAARGINTTI